MVLGSLISKHELAPPQDGAHTVLSRFPNLAVGEYRGIETTGTESRASPRTKSWRSTRHVLRTHLGFGVNAEAQQAVVDLEGDGVAPGCQILFSQQCGQAREDLRGYWYYHTEPTLNAPESLPLSETHPSQCRGGAAAGL